jgi:MoaA/NifB/PqqE/SkfB family radical SAM enzyme
LQSGASRYSHLKAARYPDRIEGIRLQKAQGPVHVQIILSDLCNQSCHFCAYRDPTYTSSKLFHIEGNYNPNRKLETEKVIEILDDCVELGVKAVQYTGGGEPTIHPDFNYLVEETMKRGLKWGLVTNGVKKRNFAGASWVRVSLDAGNSKTYSQIRSVHPSHFDRALETIRLWKTGVGFVITPENWREVYEATLLVKDLGATNIRLGAQFSEDGLDLFKDFEIEARNLCKAAESLSSESFKVHNKFNEKMKDLEGPPDYDKCRYQYFTTYIGADQNLYRCCVYAYNPRGLVGTIKGRRFKDVWYENWGTFHDFNARDCERCQFNTINKSINDMVDSEDVEFV